MKLIDADKLKDEIAENYVSKRKMLKGWDKEAIAVMDIVDRQSDVAITCCKCHGKGVHDVVVYNESCEIIGWNPTLCEVCHGTGKISLQFYEDLQRGCRR